MLTDERLIDPRPVSRVRLSISPSDSEQIIEVNEQNRSAHPIVGRAGTKA